MAMQYDVKSYHNTVSGLAVPYRARLKGVVVSPSTSSTYNVSIVDDVAQTGTYSITTTTCTVTIANHGLTTGDRVWLDFTSGTFTTDDTYSVTKLTANTFTVTVGSTTASGNVTMYAKMLTELDASTGTSYYTLIPGEGVLASFGIRVFIPSTTVTTTIFYG